MATRLCEQVIVLRVERAIKLSRSVEKRRSSYSDVTPPVTPDGTYTETGVFSSPPDHVDARAVGRDGHAVWRVVHLDLPREFERVVWIAGHIEGHDRAPCIMSMLTSNVV